MNRNYKDLIKLPSIEERYNYLKLSGKVGFETFGWDRYINQRFYHSAEWKRIRDEVIVRDNGCDLGIKEFPINGFILVHHMNPIWVEDLVNKNQQILDPNFLICVSAKTHRAIHYGSEEALPRKLIERKPGDTTLWKGGAWKKVS